MAGGKDDRDDGSRHWYRARDEWHLSKGFSISILILIVTQMITLVVWASKLDSRVATLESNEKYDREIIERRLLQLESQLPRIAVIESRQQDVIKRLDANATKLDTLLDRSIAPYDPRPK